MDGPRFDVLTQRLTNRLRRRRMLGWLTLLGVPGLATSSVADAKNKNKSKKKKPCQPCIGRKKGKCKRALPDGTTCVGGTCQGGTCVPSPPPPTCGAGGPCTVFLSSSTFQGNLGGLSGADAKCQALASAAGLPGTYRAWLSDATSAPSSRFVRSTGPYRLVDGTTIALNWADLTDGSPLLATITMTETGGDDGGNSNAWSNTQPNGQVLPFGAPNRADCLNWSTNANSPSAQGGFGNILDTTLWSAVPSVLACVNYLHLYCFQQS